MLGSELIFQFSFRQTKDRFKQIFPKIEEFTGPKIYTTYKSSRQKAYQVSISATKL
jgi:hypothetical protein